MKSIILFILLSTAIAFAQVPGSFNLVSPINGSYTNAMPYFDWNNSSEVVYYQLYVDGNLKRDNIAVNYYQLSNAEELTEGLHTWNVRAVNGNGFTQSVETWSFIVDATQPTTFNLIAPTDNNWTNNLQPTFQWSASIDAASGLAKYQLWIDNVLKKDNIASTTTSTTPVSILSNASHTWQIKAIDNVGNVRNSTQNWTINIDNKPPGYSNASSLSFDGVNDYVYLGNHNYFNMTYNKTIELWIKFFEGGTQNPRIVSKQGDNWGMPGDYSIYTSGTGSTRKIRFWIQGIGEVEAPKNLSEGTYYHIAATISGNQTSSQMRIYINGELEVSSNKSGVHNPTNTILVLGRKGYGNNSLDMFKGAIDDLRLWNICKAQDQIKQQKDISLNGNEPGLVGYWNFDETEGTTAFDQTGNNDGIIHGATFENQNLQIKFLCDLKYPADESFISDPTSTFSWGSAPDAGIGFQKFQLFVDNVLVKDNLVDSSWTLISPLSYGQHTWFVKGFDMLGNNQSSYSRTFYIDNQPPNSFNLLSPADSGIVNFPTPNLSWQPTTDFSGGSGLSKYQLWINNTINRDSIPQGVTTTAPSNALNQGAYNWFIKAYDGVGNIRQSNQTLTFFVDYEPPLPFSLISPNLEDTVKSKKPTFIWHPSSDIGSGLSRYELNIAGQPVVTVSPNDTVKQITFDLPDGNYSWFVKAFDRGGASTSSNVLSFIISAPIPPLPPELTFPPNNAQLGDELTPDLAWQSVPNASFFHAQVAYDSLFTNLASENAEVNALNWTPTLLFYGKYYWRVKTYSVEGIWSENWSSVRTFTCSLGIPNLLSPPNYSIDLPPSTQLKWTHPNNSLLFKLEIAYDSLFTNLHLIDSSIVDTTKAIAQLANYTEYFWRVRAKNNSGISSWSDTWRFRTIDSTTNVNSELEIPKSFYLAQNYPNPFNPSTNIKYQLPFRTYVYLVIYDMLGREVNTLVHEEKPAGYYELEFNAHGLPSGIYFYRIEAGNFKQTKKLILLR